MALLLTQPPLKTPFNDEQGNTAKAWAEWANKTHTLSTTVLQSGTTANRPAIIFVGQQYFDTDLGSDGKPIFVDKAGTGWITADGTSA